MGKLIQFESRRNALPHANDMAAINLTGAINLTIEGPLAEAIRYNAGMFCKSPEQFVRDWLASGFPERAA